MKRNSLRTQEIGQKHKMCADCANSYDWHELNYEGKPFLCRCKFYKGGKYSKFLADRICEHFKDYSR